MNFKNSNYLVLRALHNFISFAPFKILLVNSGSVLHALSTSAGLLLMIPLAQLAGIDFQINDDSPWGFLTYIAQWINASGFAQNLNQILLIYLLLMLIVAGLGYGRTLLGIRIQQGYTKHMRMQVYNTLLGARWEYLVTSRSSEFLHRLGTQVQSMNFVANQSIALLHKLLSMTVYTILMIAVNWQFTLMTIMCGLLVACIVLPVRWSVRDAGRKRLLGYQHIFRLLSEHLGSLKMIKSSGLEWHFQENLRTISDELEEQQITSTRAGAIISFANTLGITIGFCGILYFAVTWLDVPIANFFLLLVIMSRLMPQLAGLQQSIQQIVYLIPAYKDIEETLNAGQKMHEIELNSDNTRLGLKHAITLNQVSYRYPQAQHAIIKNLGIVVPVRQTLALIGPSGAGKTTVADLLVGLLLPTSGEVKIDGQILSGDTISQWRRSIAYVTQETFLFNDSIRNNLQWVNPKAGDEELWSALKQAAIFDCIHQLPQQLDSVIGDRGIRLSGGERQRLAIARALLSKPDLLVLDEATSALDDGNEQLIHEALVNMHGSLTIIIIAHRKNTLRYADAVLNLGVSPPQMLDAAIFNNNGITDW